jgi:predicted dehydrogenase
MKYNLKNISLSFRFCLIYFTIIVTGQSCLMTAPLKRKTTSSIHLIILAPAHFHAALLQKKMYDQIDPKVYVFAPDSEDVASYLSLIQQYNHRSETPTDWQEKVYIGADYMNKMLAEKPGNVVVVAGNNQIKIDLLKNSVDAGLNVLADKPMVITQEGFEKLVNTFAEADKKGLVLYDIMTERYEITNILQKALAQLPDVFGTIKQGTIQHPAINFESTHFFLKEVSGTPIKRPSWYFDVDQQGEGILDVTTHMVDLIQWECFPQLILDYKRDIQMFSAKHWATELTLPQFQIVTGEDTFPSFLRKSLRGKVLSVYANGEMNYVIKGIHARVSVDWKFKDPNGGGDTYSSILEGSKANLVIRQSKEEQYKPVLYIEQVGPHESYEWEKAAKNAILKLNQSYPELEMKKISQGFKIIIPQKYALGHEQHFALVVKQYLNYIKAHKTAAWEVPAMLAKYYTTTQALEMAKHAK